MSRVLPRPAARPLVAALAGAAALALTGCGANFQAQTYQERTVADGNNSAVGAIAIRNIGILPTEDGTVAAGSDAEVVGTFTNDGGEDDRLLGATTDAAPSVDLIDRRTGAVVDGIDLPRLGTTGNTASLVLRGVTDELRSGTVVEMTLRFERAGEKTLSVPVFTTGQYDEDRPRSENFHEPGQEEESSGEGSAGTSGGLPEQSENETGGSTGG